jgi:hypothetical protein
MTDFAEHDGTEEEESLADTEAEVVEVSKSLDGDDEESLADTEAEMTSLEEADRGEDD